MSNGQRLNMMERAAVNAVRAASLIDVSDDQRAMVAGGGR
jgi:hypothetical protein